MQTPIILASASPRRQELLGFITNDFIVIPAEIEEVPQKNETAKGYADRLAFEKAEAIFQRYPDHFIIGADTVVCKGRRILEKPRDRLEAEHFLRLLSGGRHRVYTGVCVLAPSGAQVRKVIMSSVRFFRLHDNEINHYLDSNEWEGKAGGYAIQGRGALLVKDIQGCHFNIVGLPISVLARCLRGLGAIH
ncbi:MAG: septum formation protein Maf [Alphaproteobacteria bacterium]|jgi:septum formation protein|nr:septum formation protein Maf [Alphaproteobacteria bacterium]